LFEFTESEGQILVLGTFALFGVALLPAALQNASPTVLVYALLSLTIVRMLPVLLSLMRVKLLLSSRFFLAWFGPRGLASLLFVLLIGEQSGLPQIELITTIVFCTVALSIVLHGITAGPIAKHYGNAVHQIEIHPTDSALSSTLRPREETP
jgi:NhaP-type Na+/H+ or K+/H+ antiporter